MGGRRIVEVIRQMASDNETNLKAEELNEMDVISEEYANDDIAPLDDNNDQEYSPEQDEQPANDVKENTEAPMPQMLVPSLRGKYEVLPNTVVCKGFWAMSDAGHAFADQISAFEFKLSKGSDASLSFPVDGKYHGWFFLKQPPPFKALKIDDKDMFLKFTKNESSNSYSVDGKGTNRFGSFILYGTLQSTGEMQLYREYAPKAVHNSKKVSEPKVKSSVTAPIEDSSPREGTSRVRKVSTAMKDYEDSLLNKPKVPIIPKVIAQAPIIQPVSMPSSVAQNGVLGRSQRLPPAVVKCSELLKEMMKYPQAVWFLEPVDHIKLGIPDYVKIITKPMDFGTISKNIEKGMYETPDQFAEHMRLVFRNAITYNQMRDHPVHVAARELNAKFEDKYRALLSHLSTITANTAALVAVDSKITRQLSSSSSKKGKTGRASGSWNKTRPASVGGGPRFEAFLPPVVDPGSASIIEMQKKMQEMQDELVALRTAMRQKEVKSDIDERRNAARDPLTFEEKRNLITQIHKLPGDKMEHVIEIVQAALKPGQRGDGNEDIEIPLDALDTLTLRKLQRYVEDCIRPNKRPAAPTVRTSGASKRSRTDKSESAGSMDPYLHETVLPENSEFLDEELLFDTNALEEEGVQTQTVKSTTIAQTFGHSSQMQVTSSTELKQHTVLHTINTSPDDVVNFEDDDLRTMLATPGKSDISNQNLGSFVSDSVTLRNESAWDAEGDGKVENHESPGRSTAVVGDEKVWEKMASELQAKQVRENQRKEELERLNSLRLQQETERLKQLQREAELMESIRLQEQQQILAQKQKEDESAALLLQQRKEEERRRREEDMRVAATTLDSRELMMMLDDDDT